MKTIQDVDTAQTSDEPAGWSTPTGGGLHLVTDHEHDELGRVTQTLGPLHTVDLDGVATSLRSAAWVVHDDAANETRSARGYALPGAGSSSSSSSSSSGGSGGDYTYTLVNPVSIVKRDAAGNVLEQISATRASTSGRLVASDTFAQSSYVRWTTNQRSSCCEQVSTRVYHAIPTSGDGADGTNYDQTSFDQTARGLRNHIKTPGGTITSTVFDARDLPISIYVSTDDSGATDSDPTGGGAQNNNMVLVTANQYDGGSDGGNALVTRVTQHVDSSTTRVTGNTYDYRCRQTAVDGELDFYEKRYFDNLGRVTKTERYDTTAAGALIARSETFYDDAGRTYQTKRYAVNPSDGSVGNALVSNVWYDASGRKIKDQPAGSKLFTKTVYDSLSRATKTYRGYDVDETSYADAASGAGDTILEQSEPTYDDAGAVIQTTTRARFHNATGTGELTTPGGSQPKARVTHTAAFPDAIGRSQATADYGAFGGSTFSRPNIIPNRADTILVTSTEYDDTGQAFKTTDPAGAEHRQEFDDAGRTTKTIQNYTDGDPSTGGADEDVTVETAYNSDGQVLTLTAKNATTGDQTTTYVYGTTLTDSDVARKDLLRAEIYPDSDDTTALGDGVDTVYDRVECTYNRLGQRTTVKDQNGSIHTHTFDALGRETEDAITTLAAGVDGAVRRISKSYEVRGMVDTITSHDAASGGNVVNQSVFEFNDAGLLSKEYQEHSGAKDGSTPYVGYNYDETAALGEYTKGLRPSSVRYPNGRLVHFTYSASDAINRLDAIKDDNAGSPGSSLAESAISARRPSSRKTSPNPTSVSTTPPAPPVLTPVSTASAGSSTNSGTTTAPPPITTVTDSRTIASVTVSTVKTPSASTRTSTSSTTSAGKSWKPARRPPRVTSLKTSSPSTNTSGAPATSTPRYCATKTPTSTTSATTSSSTISPTPISTSPR